MTAEANQKKMPGVGAPGETTELGKPMSDQKTTAPVVTVDEARATIEWNVRIGDETAWESILVEVVDGQMEISGRGDGPVTIPLENLGIVMAYMVELNVQATEGVECGGHESLDGAHMGVTVLCDGSCS